MNFNNLSGNNLIGLASSVSIAIAQNFNSEETALLSAFLTSVADNLALISIQQAKKEESSNSSS